MKIQNSPHQSNSTPNFDLERYLKKPAKSLTDLQLDSIRKHPCAGSQEFIETFFEKTRVHSDEFAANFIAYITCASIVELESLSLEHELVQMEKRNHLDTAVSFCEILWAAYPNISRSELMGILDWKRGDLRYTELFLRDMVTLCAPIGIAYGPTYTLKTEAIREAIRLRFVATPELEGAAHAKIAAYFLKVLKSASAPLSDYGRTNLVKHLVLSGDHDGVTEVLSDLRYLESRVCAKEIDATLEDFAKAAAFLAESPAHLQKLEAFRRLFASNRVALTIEGGAEGVLVQIAYNDSASGLLREAAEKALTGKSPVALQKIQGPLAIKGDAACRAILEPTAKEKNICINFFYFAVPSPDGRLLATAGEENGMIRIWNLETGVCLNSWQAHDFFVCALHFSSDGQRLISIGEGDERIRIWDVATVECLNNLEGHTSPPYPFALSLNASRAVSFSMTETIVWTLGPDTEHIRLRDVERLYECHISPDGKWVIGRSVDELRVWDASTGDVVRQMNGTACAIDVKWENAVVSSAKGEIRIDDPLSGQTRRVLDETGLDVSKLVISSDGSKAVALCKKSHLIVWDVASGRRLHEWKTDDKLNEVRISNDGSFVASSYSNELLGTNIPVRVWSVATGDLLLLAAHPHQTDFKFTPDNRKLITAGIDISCRVWELPSEAWAPLTGVNSSVISMAFSSQGDRCFVGKENGTLEVWDSTSAECVKVLDGHKNKIVDLQISPCGKRLVSCAEKELRVWDLEHDTCIVSLEDDHFSTDHLVQITSDSKLLVTAGSNDPGWRVWDMDSGELLQKRNAHAGVFSSLKISDDDKRLLTSSCYCEEKGPKIWDLATGECLHALKGKANGVQGTDATGDFQYVFSASFDEMHLWNGHTGECIRKSDLFYDETVSMVTSGRRIISLPSHGRSVLVYHMRKVRFWDLETLEPIQEFCGHDTTLESVSMRPDGKFVAYLDAYGFLQMKRSDGTPVFHAFCRDAEIFTIDWDKGSLAVGYADGRVEFHQSTLSNSL